MARGHHTALYWVVVECVEELIDMRIVHLEDGRICPKEEDRERKHIERVLLPAAVNSADAEEIASTIRRYGPEVDSVQRKLKRRAARMGNVIPFPDTDTDPDDGAPNLKAA
jgi:hypothetical protein